jgi:DNA-binding transcriptional MerR regulator
MKTYSITQLSKEFDVTTRTLRFYEEKGMLNPQRKGQARIYSSSDRARLKLILRGKRLGLTLEESRDIILMYDPVGSNRKQIEALVEKIKEKRCQLIQQQKELELMIFDLQGWEDQWMNALENCELESDDIATNAVVQSIHKGTDNG